MIIIPAIDIQGGKVVRLKQGKFDDTKEYGDNPASIAKKWETAGAQMIHIIDLDGAQKGSMQNFDAIIKTAQSVKTPVQVGGGIRAQEDITALLTNGVTRVVLGTKIVDDPGFLKEILSRWKERIVVSIDCKDGLVSQRGWTSQSNKKGTEFAKELEALGLKTLVYTDIARDGMLTGPNIPRIKEILDCVNISVIASGGVSTLEDIKKLKTLEPEGLNGIIIGKALYEKRFELQDAVELGK